jgi:hypothetical protein
MVLNMLMRTRKIVMRRLILPGTHWEAGREQRRQRHLGVYKEGDPADHHKQGGGEVVGDHIEGHLPHQHQLEPRHTRTFERLKKAESRYHL